MNNRHSIYQILVSPLFLFLGWVVVTVVMLGAIAGFEHRRLMSEFHDEATVMHRLVSQRADQHDAHLTALSAIADSETEGRDRVFLNVASTIQQFYPRVKDVDLVSLTPGGTVLSTRDGLSAERQQMISAAAEGSHGELVVAKAPGDAGRYLLIKRSPNNENARYGLALEVDGLSLLGMDSDFWSRPAVTRSLALPDRSLLAGEPPTQSPQFMRRLSSQSQPLELSAGIRPALSDLLPWGLALALMILSSLLYLALALWLRQRVFTRRAERQAEISAREARLAHASRVNALGEMASGMAHELTQPLTAILSQAQAGRHLAARGDMEAVGSVLQSIADQSKRASAIIMRLRNWSRMAPEETTQVHLAGVLQNVELLLSAEARKNGVTLAVDAAEQDLVVRGEQVALEQIVFNLVRNAIEAVEGVVEKQVSVSARAQGSFAEIDVSDTGPGVPDAIRDRLFEPFATGKPNGTGLGLTLCQRLAEGMGGDIRLLPEATRTTFQVRIPLEGSNGGEAER